MGARTAHGGDSTQAEGARVSSLQLLRAGSWGAFDTARTCHVITNTFTTTGGDNYLIAI